MGLEGFAAVGIAEGGFEFGAEGDARRRGVERAAEIGKGARQGDDADEPEREQHHESGARGAG